jgi:hypothetical protein
VLVYERTQYITHGFAGHYTFHLFSGKMARRLFTVGREKNVNSEKYLCSTFTGHVEQLAIVTWLFRVLYECLWSANLVTGSDTT